jgi:hypothetical protein
VEQAGADLFAFVGQPRRNHSTNRCRRTAHST